MTPDSRTTGTTGMSVRKRAGTSLLNSSIMGLRISGIGWIAAGAMPGT